MKPLFARLARVALGALCLVTAPHLGPVAEAGSTTATIRGVVKDHEGAVLPGATVDMVLEGYGTKLVATTDDKGKFMQPGVRPGTWEITVKKEGFETFAQPIRLSLGDKTPVEITLAKTVAATTAGAPAGFTLGDVKVSQEAGEAFQAAQTALGAKDDAAAREALTKFLALEANVPAAYFMLAQVERDSGNAKRATELLQTGLEKEPSNVPAMVSHGELLLEAGDTENAIASFRKASEIAPNEAHPWRKLGIALLGKQDFAGATTALENYLRLAPDAPDAAEKKALLEEVKKLSAKPAAK